MAIASLVVRIAADIADFEKNISAVERALQKTGNNLEQIGTQLTKGLTLPILAIAGTAAKAAIDFESSFAGVRKTVKATDEQFKELEGQFRNLAKTMPLTVNEINKVAESAGQLGVKREDIAAFTETMIKMGTATNLTADEAAVGMQRFANAIGQPRINMEQLGSSIVALGQQGASTEKDILELGLRMAGTGAQIGLTAGEIFGMANALSSVGIQAEKGGTAISTLFKDISEAVSFGGSALKEFAEVAFGDIKGASDQFAKLFKEDAAGAITKFVEGLGAIKAAGGDLLPVLDQLGITEKRYNDTVLLAANASKDFAASVKLGNQAFNEGKALNEEYQERLKTTASQLIILKNNVMDVAVTFGQAMLPAINSIVSGSKPLVGVLAGMAEGFKALPGPLRDTSLAFLAVLAAAGPVVFIASQVTKAWASLLAIVGFVPIALSGISTAFIALAGVMGATTTGLTGVTGAMVLLRSAAAALLAPIAAIPLAIVGIVSAAPKAAEGLKNMNAAVTTGRFWEFVTTKHAPGIWEPEFWGISRSAKAAAISIDDLANARAAAAVDTKIRTLEGIRDDLSGAKVAEQVRDLANAFASLSPEAQRSELAMKKTGAAALRLRDDGGQLTPELDKLANQTIRSLASETKKAGKEIDAAAESVRNLRDEFSGAKLAADVKHIENAFRALTDEQRKSPEVQKRVGEAIETLRQDGARLSPELLALSVRTEAFSDWLNKVPGQTDLWATSFRNMRTALEKPLEQLRDVNDVLLDIARQQVPIVVGIPDNVWSVIGQGREVPIPDIPAETLINPFREAFANLDLAGLILAAFKSDSLADGVAVVASGLASEFTRVFSERVAEAAKTGTQLSGSSKAIGLAGLGLTSFIGGFGAGEELGKGKGALAGAASGALAGAAFGPWGAAIGGIAGAIGGLIGGAKKAKEALKELREAQAAVIQEFGGMAALKAKADEFGISLGNALTTKNPEEFARTMERLGAAIDAQKVRIEGFGIAVEGINTKAALFAIPFEKLIKAREEGEINLRIIDAKLAETGQRGQAEFERIGTFAAAAFAGMVKESGDAVGAIRALEPTLVILQRGLDEFGLTSTGTINSLLGMFTFINDKVSGPIFEAIQATGQIFAGLTQGGLVTKDIFQLVATDIGASFKELERKGGDVAMAMALSQPVLQALWEGQKRYGTITDETTQRILKQAEEQGLVGDHMKDVNQKILDVLIAIADVFGAKLPDAFRATAGAAQDAARGIQREFSAIRIKIPIEYDVSGMVLPKATPFSSGGIVRRPTLALIGEAGPEAVIPLNQLASVSPQVGSSIHIWEVGGRVLAEATVEHLPGVVRHHLRPR